MGDIGFPELLVILAIALVVFGGKRLPEIARSMGKSIHEFKRGLKEGEQAGEEPKQSPVKTIEIKRVLPGYPRAIVGRSSS